MSHDNPFQGTDTRGQSSLGANEEGSLAPADLDLIPILTRCWELFGAHPGLVIAAIGVQVVPSLAFSLVETVLNTFMEGAEPPIALALGAIYLCVFAVNLATNLFFSLGTTRVFSRLARGLPAEAGMLFGEGRRFLQALVAGFLYSAAVLAGLVAFVIPAFVISVGLQFWMYALVDQDLPAVDALRESWRLTTGYKLTVFLTNLAIGILGLALTCATCGLGYLVLLPLLLLSSAVIYHSLTHLQGRAEAPLPG